MAGPTLTGVRAVTNPYEDLQKAVSSAGDIYRNYANDKREQDRALREAQEYERQNHQRQVLAEYKPEFGVGGAGLDTETNLLANRQAETIWKAAQDRANQGEQVDFNALRKELQAAKGSLATQESAYQSILNDLHGRGVDAQTAELVAKTSITGLQSRQDLLAKEQSRADAALKKAEAAKGNFKYIMDYDLRVAAEDNNNRLKIASDAAGSKTAGTSSGASSVPASIKYDYKAVEAAKDMLNDRVTGFRAGWFDGKEVDKVIRDWQRYNLEPTNSGKQVPLHKLIEAVTETIDPDNFDKQLSKGGKPNWSAWIKDKFGDLTTEEMLGFTGVRGGVGSAYNYVAPELTSVSLSPANRRALLSYGNDINPRSYTDIQSERVNDAFSELLNRYAPKTQDSNNLSVPRAKSAGSTNTSGDGVKQTTNKTSNKKEPNKSEDKKDATIVENINKQLGAVGGRLPAGEGSVLRSTPTGSVVESPTSSTVPRPTGDVPIGGVLSRFGGIEDNGVVTQENADREIAIRKLEAEIIQNRARQAASAGQYAAYRGMPTSTGNVLMYGYQPAYNQHVEDARTVAERRYNQQQERAKALVQQQRLAATGRLQIALQALDTYEQGLPTNKGIREGVVTGELDKLRDLYGEYNAALGNAQRLGVNAVRFNDSIVDTRLPVLAIDRASAADIIADIVSRRSTPARQ